MTTENTQLQISNSNDFRVALATNYQKQINNFFGDEKKALRFMSSAVSAVQTNPSLLECTPASLLNSFITMASLELMPSNVSGEAYVLPYKSRNGTVAQFQLGYQGLVTLFYRAGARSITAEIVYQNDTFSITNGVITHSPDVFSTKRGDPIGAYVIVELQAGGKVSKVMNKSEIMAIGEKFSKSFKTDFSPWNPKNDPELWMWKKTVLRQVAKLVPKNETIYRALSADNEDSIIADQKRIEEAKKQSESLTMGNFQKNENKKTEKSKDEIVAPESDEGQIDIEAAWDDIGNG